MQLTAQGRQEQKKDAQNPLREMLPNCQYFGKYKRGSVELFRRLMKEFESPGESRDAAVRAELDAVFGAVDLGGDAAREFERICGSAKYLAQMVNWGIQNKAKLRELDKNLREARRDEEDQIDKVKANPRRIECLLDDYFQSSSQTETQAKLAELKSLCSKPPVDCRSTEKMAEKFSDIDIDQYISTLTCGNAEFNEFLEKEQAQFERFQRNSSENNELLREVFAIQNDIIKDSEDGANGELVATEDLDDKLVDLKQEIGNKII